MTYDEALNGIHSRKAFSTGGPSLDRIGRLMERLGNPQERFRVVHVAGTNGKGSVSAMIAAALQESGKRTGLFTSPYLVDFRERIQIDRVPVSRELLASCYEVVMAEETKLEEEGFEPVNEFELVTAIGFTAFAAANVEYVVLEVGLGGRTDPTNLVKRPEVCCITPISLDHTAILGNTIEEIAGEKAGIIKPGCPVVVANQTEEALGVFREKAEHAHAMLVQVGETSAIEETMEGTTFRYGDKTLFTPLLGAYQMNNSATAWEACRVLGLEENTVKRAFEKVVWPGRMQFFAPNILVDAGHNVAGITALKEMVQKLFAGKKIISVMAMMKDKAYGQCIPMIAEISGMVIGTSVGLPRSLEPAELTAVAKEYCATETADTVVEAIEMAKVMADGETLILVCGSVYAAGAAVGMLMQETDE